VATIVGSVTKGNAYGGDGRRERPASIILGRMTLSYTLFHCQFSLSSFFEWKNSPSCLVGTDLSHEGVIV